MNTHTLIVPDDWYILNDAERRNFLASEFGDAQSSTGGAGGAAGAGLAAI